VGGHISDDDPEGVNVRAIIQGGLSGELLRGHVLLRAGGQFQQLVVVLVGETEIDEFYILSVVGDE